MKTDSPFKIAPTGPSRDNDDDDDISRAEHDVEAKRSPETEAPTFESVDLSNTDRPSTYDGGMTSEYSAITKDLDKEMRQLIKDYEISKKNQDNKTDLILKRMRLKHPIFQLITHSAFKFIMESC